MTFKEAADFIMPFGKYRRDTLDEIAKTDAGLKYLDWLRGERKSGVESGGVDRALCVYLDDPAIAKELRQC